jgi:hypothetical protein
MRRIVFSSFFAAVSFAAFGCASASDATDASSSAEPPPPVRHRHAVGCAATYATGALVTFQGSVFRCLQGHTSQPDWTPEHRRGPVGARKLRGSPRDGRGDDRRRTASTAREGRQRRQRHPRPRAERTRARTQAPRPPRIHVRRERLGLHGQLPERLRRSRGRIPAAGRARTWARDFTANK